MSKFSPLWQYIKDNYDQEFQLSFDQIQKIVGLPIDHSFLTYKKELLDYGFKVGKISLKNKTVDFEKLEGKNDAKIR
ncbi:hypothetical protein [Lactobacillus johnsonii]|uniref:Uncharacterized protein n=1 Tax=Lactobacillus johnsonii TaxID=33959 RepID=A0A9X6RXK6_LACJH|nr:hypothetical protein [Lactobacillus johnsonii]OYS05891.1 hypothetical protein CBF54_00985 [Lactobacillus johnsonii]OYS09186.1 hypothetical protein CBF62_01125 [Lactobacillus johnsonii]OYS10618.1 hypothetical protein CBF65_00990 [Lactobacillus johnsonii]OYS11255.1 hypothetical protein CBF63_00600 [Lactobacillus johnsonii]OYS11415.1 hypothetical protein CBF48_09215 [Lactobacillus johnsonii]